MPVTAWSVTTPTSKEPFFLTWVTWTSRCWTSLYDWTLTFALLKKSFTATVKIEQCLHYSFCYCDCHTAHSSSSHGGLTIVSIAVTGLGHEFQKYKLDHKLWKSHSWVDRGKQSGPGTQWGRTGFVRGLLYSHLIWFKANEYSNAGGRHRNEEHRITQYWEIRLNPSVVFWNTSSHIAGSVVEGSRKTYKPSEQVRQARFQGPLGMFQMYKQ